MTNDIYHPQNVWRYRVVCETTDHIVSNRMHMGTDKDKMARVENAKMLEQLLDHGLTHPRAILTIDNLKA